MKRSDPNYIQVEHTIQGIKKDVRRLLVDYEGDFSDLVTQLLEDWVEQ